jgi:hypothetical protein
MIIIIITNIIVVVVVLIIILILILILIITIMMLITPELIMNHLGCRTQPLLRPKISQMGDTPFWQS